VVDMKKFVLVCFGLFGGFGGMLVGCFVGVCVSWFMLKRVALGVGV